MTDPDFRLSSAEENVHSDWDKARQPRLTVEPGDVVRFECLDAHGGQVTEESTAEDVLSLDPSPVHPLTGPVAVSGAEPGDTLAVELLECRHHGFGYTLFYPRGHGKGLLTDEFDEPGLHVWELDGDIGRFVDGIEVPLDPFPGIVGVAPDEPGSHSTSPPRRVGGNLDVKHFTAGSTVYLPVEVPGALFSVGDCHAAQGDGEVCVTGIEAPMDVTVRFDLRPELTVTFPRFETDHPFTPTGSDERMVGTTGVSDDLRDAARSAVLQMMDHLETERGLTRRDAYLLCSVAVDLKVSEIVNPNVVVSAYLPESIFPN